MRRHCVLSLCAAVGGAVVIVPQGANAAVDLVLRASPQIADAGWNIEVKLYAVSTEGTSFSAVDVLLEWDAGVLELREVVRGDHPWNFLFGFLSDAALDRLNADCGPDAFCQPYTALPFNDGDAMFQALAFTPAVATADGLLVATFQFLSVEPASSPAPTQVVLVPHLGMYSHTRVLQPTAANVTGQLQNADVIISTGISLSALDVHMAAGRTAAVVVEGAISDKDPLGVEILVELVSRPSNSGAVTYTPSPPPDVVQLGDPWPGAGLFTPLDTDTPGHSETLNASVDENGTVVGSLLTYSGLLSAFPVMATSDARGVWDLILCRAPCSIEEVEGLSRWSGPPRDPFPPTALRHGTITIVDPGDGNGNRRVDLRDFKELQACYTGAIGSADPPVYSLLPEHRCSVYDITSDGAVDRSDHAGFLNVMSGP